MYACDHGRLSAAQRERQRVRPVRAGSERDGGAVQLEQRQGASAYARAVPHDLAAERLRQPGRARGENLRGDVQHRQYGHLPLGELGVAVQCECCLERGERNVSLMNILTLGEAFGVDPAAFLTTNSALYKQFIAKTSRPT